MTTRKLGFHDRCLNCGQFKSEIRFSQMAREPMICATHDYWGEIEEEWPKHKFHWTRTDEKRLGERATRVREEEKSLGIDRDEIETKIRKRILQDVCEFVAKDAEKNPGKWDALLVGDAFIKLIGDDFDDVKRVIAKARTPKKSSR